MPTWPTLYPALENGKVNTTMDSRRQDVKWHDEVDKDILADHTPLSNR